MDYYREWSYSDRCEHWREHGYDHAVERWDRDNESSEAAYESWRNGGEFSDPNDEGRFH